MHTTYTVNLGILGEETLDIFYTYTPGHPARLSGPPEDCYPEEPPEISIHEIKLMGRRLSPDLENLLAERLEVSEDFLDYIEGIWQERNLP